MNLQKRTIKFLERKEIEKLIEGIKPEGYRGLRDRALMEVLFSTGMRIHEALALDCNEVRILLEEKGTSEFPIIGKGGWQRVVYFSPKAKSAIKAYLPQWAEFMSDKERLFPMTPRCAQLMVKRRAKEQGFEKRITPHIFRHSLATDLLRKGVDIRFVSEFLGHRSINNTMIYTHVVNEQLKVIHKKLYK